jgi:hypothetical protein
MERWWEFRAEGTRGIGCSRVRCYHHLSDPNIRTTDHTSDGHRDGVPLPKHVQ